MRHLFFWLSMLLFFTFSSCTEEPSTEKQSERCQDCAEKPIEQSVDASEPVVEKIPREPQFEKPSGPAKVANGSKGRIVHITDGDTLYIITGIGGWKHKVRLKGLNAPECYKKSAGSFQSCDKDKDYFGLEAFNILKKKVDSFQNAYLEIICLEKNGLCDKDDNDRFLLTLKVDEKHDLTEALLLEGAGFAFTRYTTPKLKDYCIAEAAAIKAKKGIWKNGRQAVSSKMNSSVKSWYYNRKKGQSHDEICTKLIGKDFKTLAGE